MWERSLSRDRASIKDAVHCALTFETKAGPFDPARAKEAAAWAPEEGSADAAAYLEKLRRLAVNGP